MQAAQKARRKQDRAVVVNVWVAEIRGNGVSAVSGVDAFQVGRNFVEGRFPSHPLPAARRATHRMSQAIGVEMEVLQGDGLGTDVTVAERVVFVAPDC